MLKVEPLGAVDGGGSGGQETFFDSSRGREVLERCHIAEIAELAHKKSTRHSSALE